MIERDAIEVLLANLGNHLSKPTILCVIGSTASIVMGQSSRQSSEISVWHPYSSFDAGDLKRACEEVGLIYDPKGEVDPDPDAICLQIIRPGIVPLPHPFGREAIGQYGSLTLVMPPPDVIAAASLAGGSDTDIEDAVWWVRGRDLTDEQISDAIDRIPSQNSRDAAKENLYFIQLISRGYGEHTNDLISNNRIVRSKRELRVEAIDALIRNEIIAVGKRRDWELLEVIARLAENDAPVDLAVTDSTLYIALRNAITKFHLNGWTCMTPERVRTVADKIVNG